MHTKLFLIYGSVLFTWCLAGFALADWLDQVLGTDLAWPCPARTAQRIEEFRKHPVLTGSLIAFWLVGVIRHFKQKT